MTTSTTSTAGPRTPKADPSRIARAVAGALWPDVQSQTCFAPGVYWFHCAGHGGCVAVIEAAELPAIAVDVARNCKKTELALFIDYGGQRRPRTEIRTSVTYKADSLREAARTDRRCRLYEVWVGEEDCDWACLVHAAPSLIAAARKRLNWALTGEDVDSCLGRWNADFRDALHAALTPEHCDACGALTLVEPVEYPHGDMPDDTKTFRFCRDDDACVDRRSTAITARRKSHPEAAAASDTARADGDAPF